MGGKKEKERKIPGGGDEYPLSSRHNLSTLMSLFFRRLQQVQPDIYEQAMVKGNIRDAWLFVQGAYPDIFADVLDEVLSRF